MPITDGYHDVPPGRLAAVVTYLEMRQPPPVMDAPLPPSLEVVHVVEPAADWYRDLFRRVGEHWLWFSRALMTDEQLESIIHDSRIEVYALQQQGVAHGLLELDLREFPEIEITFFGLTANWIGKGAGRFLIQHGIRQAFRHSPERLFLHTCTLDSPGALAFYQKAGFRPYKRAIEIAPDPRHTGRVPRHAAPQIPIL